MNELDPRIAGRNWEECFAFSSGETVTRHNGLPSSCGEPPVSEAPFKRSDVAVVEALHDTTARDWDGWSGVGVFLLKDGRWACIEAGCDYTGWDCQSGGSSRVAATRENIIRFGLTVEQRAQLGLSLPDDEGALK